MSKPTIKLDRSGTKTKKTGQVFDLDHARELLRLQNRKGRKNWTISSGQPYSEKDGEIITTTSSSAAEIKS